MKNKSNEIKTVSAKKYLKDKYGIYEFPFKVLDDTPGGTNLGRIEICIELFRSKRKVDKRYYIEKIWLWFKQTRDKKYRGKIFEIPCFTECIGGDYIGMNSFTASAWRVYYCDVHRQIIMEAYPQNNHSKLLIDVSSSIMVDIDFK